MQKGEEKTARKRRTRISTKKKDKMELSRDLGEDKEVRG